SAPSRTSRGGAPRAPRTPPRTRPSRSRATGGNAGASRNHGLDQAAPALAEDPLRGLGTVGGQARVADAASQRGILPKLGDGERQRLGVAGRNEQRARAVGEELARRRGVGGDDRDAAGERLEDLVGDYAPRLVGGAEDPEGAAGAAELVRQALVLHPRYVLDVRRPVIQERLELSRPDDLEAQIGREAGRFQHGFEPVQRDQLADEERLERPCRFPAGREDPLFGADEADLDSATGDPGKVSEKVGARFGVGDDEIRRAECVSVDDTEHPTRGRVFPEAPAVGAEGGGEGDQRVEDDGPAGGGSARGREVELAGVADHERVELRGRASEEPKLRDREPCCGRGAGLPVVPRSFPDGDVALDHVDARPAQRRNDLRVARVVALIGAEVENAQRARARLGAAFVQERISSTWSSACSRPPALSSYWLVSISLISPSEENWSPTTTSKTPSVRSGRSPIACPSALRTVRYVSTMIPIVPSTSPRPPKRCSGRWR